MKRILLMVLLLTAASANGKSLFKTESGLGIEYGGLGFQAIAQMPFKSLELYGALGITEDIRENERGIRGGIGANFFVTKHISLTTFGGIIDVDRYRSDEWFGGDLELTEYEYERQYGGSIGVKLYVSGQDKPGWVIGATYSASSDDSFGFVSLAYRF